MALIIIIEKEESLIIHKKVWKWIEIPHEDVVIGQDKREEKIAEVEVNLTIAQRLF